MRLWNNLEWSQALPSSEVFTPVVRSKAWPGNSLDTLKWSPCQPNFSLSVPSYTLFFDFQWDVGTRDRGKIGLVFMWARKNGRSCFLVPTAQEVKSRAVEACRSYFGHSKSGLWWLGLCLELPVRVCGSHELGFVVLAPVQELSNSFLRLLSLLLEPTCTQPVTS